MGAVEPIFPLLALCARAQGHPAQVLADILTCYQAAGIDVLVLKGAALAHLVYPQPVLRPMRDIDILVRAEDVYRAYARLPEIGFTPPRRRRAGVSCLYAAGRRVRCTAHLPRPSALVPSQAAQQRSPRRAPHCRSLAARSAGRKR